jgi:hypothetical protein
MDAKPSRMTVVPSMPVLLGWLELQAALESKFKLSPRDISLLRVAYSYGVVTGRGCDDDLG